MLLCVCVRNKDIIIASKFAALECVCVCVHARVVSHEYFNLCEQLVQFVCLLFELSRNCHTLVGCIYISIFNF